MISSPTFIEAERLRRLFSPSVKKIFHLIADTHAMDHFPAQVVADLAKKTQALVMRAVMRLGLSGHYEMIFASELQERAEYKVILDSVKVKVATDSPSLYFLREAADIEYFRLHHRVGIKLSWMLQAKKSRLDERSFDLFYRTLFAESSLSFVYTVPGRTFSQLRPHVCPYVSQNGELRVMITDEPWADQIREWEKEHPKTMTHLQKIVAGFEELFGSLEASGTAEKVDLLIQRLFFSG